MSAQEQVRSPPPCGGDAKYPAWLRTFVPNIVKGLYPTGAGIVKLNLGVRCPCTAFLAARNIRPRLNNKNLPLHVRPLNILIATPKHSLDLRGRTNESTDNIVSQHNTIAGYRYFLHSTILVKRQQTIFS